MSRIQDALDQALALHYRGENREAAAICQRILAMVPNEPGAMHLKGRIALDEGRAEEAVALMRKAIQRSPSSVAYHVDIGRAYAILERWSDAAASFQRALRLHKNHAEALIGLGRALLKQEQPQAALEALERARAAAPDNPFALNEQANALLALGRLGEAAAVLQCVIELVPESARAHVNLASCLSARGDLDDAIGWLEKAVALDPTYRDAHETLASFHLSRAMAWLRDGRFEEGWPELEWRWKTKDYQRLSGGFAGPMWDGSDLRGGTILLHGEQGLGDAIQFVRYAPMVKARGGRVFLGCHRPLARLFRRLADVERLIVQGDEPFPVTDARAPLMSLPRLFGTTLATIPAPVPYLSADPVDVAAWRDRLAEYTGRKVGLVWAGNPQHAFDALRSIPVECLQPLADVPDTVFFNLQFGDAAPAFARLAGKNFVDLSADLGDLLNTAAIMMNLDAIVSIDTSAAHLAGALGRPAWTLLSTAADWRWLKDRDDSPWYPTMRLFRQSTPGDWADVIARVRAELTAIPLPGR